MIGYIPKYLGAGISNRLSARTRASNFCANRTPYKLWMDSSKSNIANENGIRINTPRTHQLEQSNRRIKKIMCTVMVKHQHFGLPRVYAFANLLFHSFVRQTIISVHENVYSMVFANAKQSFNQRFDECCCKFGCVVFQHVV